MLRSSLNSRIQHIEERINPNDQEDVRLMDEMKAVVAEIEAGWERFGIKITGEF